MKKKIAIIGGGAAGVFCAIQLGYSEYLEVNVIEKSNELLKKVKISGGGRCNVTHRYTSLAQFSKNYPRGNKLLKQNLTYFSPADMQQWLVSKGVKLKIESDGRIFPISDDSQTIIDCFQRELKLNKVQVHYQSEVRNIIPSNGKFIVEMNQIEYEYDILVCATGGAQKMRELDMFSSMKIATISPVPSLFTFKINDKSLTSLMGISIQDVSIRIIGSSYSEIGSLLITHWGLSGPAILKLSAWGAFYLHSLDYSFSISINWCGGENEEVVKSIVEEMIQQNGMKKVVNHRMEKFSIRLWQYLMMKAEIDMEKRWIDLSKKNLNKLSQVLTNTVYEVNGKTTFKEEFVTAGGIDLSVIDSKTMQCTTVPNLYLIGELTNVDGITGGFNFQNAWTSATICAKSILSK